MRVPAEHRNTQIHRERDMRALSRLAMLLFCGLVLAGGFVFAAQQHFAAVKYGYTSEELRQERERLLREQQQLMLLKEQASAPARLETAARALGLRPMRSTQVGMSHHARTSSSPPQVKASAADKRKQR